MLSEIRTPQLRSAARPAGPGTWRKKVLPVGVIDYKGRRLEFDKPYLQGLAASYNARAYDQVPFQIADTGNNHTNDPERYRGEVTGMSVDDDGLYITLKPTPDGHALLETNPNLGVSARIVEDYARSDGQKFPAAIQHVLGTLDPRIPGLGAWERVDLSNFHPEVVIDLSAATFAGEEGGISMPELNAQQADKLSRLLELDPDRLGALLNAVPGTPPPTPPPASDGSDMSDADLAALIEGMTDEEFGQLADEFDLNEGEPVAAGAQLSNTYGDGALDLANYRLAETERQMAVLQGEHDRQAFENEKRRLSSLGVPPFITDLARPLLEGSGHTVELSNGQSTDAGLVIRKVLTEFGKAAAMLDLSVELGSSADEPTDNPGAVEARDDIVARYRQQTGL